MAMPRTSLPFCSLLKRFPSSTSCFPRTGPVGRRAAMVDSGGDVGEEAGLPGMRREAGGASGFEAWATRGPRMTRCRIANLPPTGS